MALPTILTLPNECTDVIFRALPLQDASRLGETCTHLHRALIRNLPGLSTVLSLSHTSITSDQLKQLCCRANCKVRALSVAGCDNLNPSGLASVIRNQIGHSLVYLDISACSQLLVDDAFLLDIAAYLPNLRVLRLTHSPHISTRTIEAMQKEGFGKCLRTLDISFSPEMFELSVKEFPVIKTIIAPGSRFERHLIEFGLHPEENADDKDNLGFVRLPYTDTGSIVVIDLWSRIECDDIVAWNGFLDAIIKPLTEIPEPECIGIDTAALVAQLPHAFATACTWNRHCERAVRGPRRFASHLPARGSRRRSTLVAYATPFGAARIARSLVLTCGINPLAGRERCALTAAILADPVGPPIDGTGLAPTSVVAALVPRSCLSLVQPVAVALLVLAAARRNADAVSVLIPELPQTRPEGVVALCAALRAVFDPSSKICFPTRSVADGLWKGPWNDETGFSSSWLTNTFVNTEVRLPDFSSPLDGAAQSADVKAHVSNTGRVVRELLRRGASYDHRVVRRAAQQGEWDALRVLLFCGTEADDIQGFGDGDTFALARGGKWNLELVLDRLFPVDQKEGTVLGAAVKCTVPFLAQTTVSFLLDLFEIIETQIAIKSATEGFTGIGKHVLQPRGDERRVSASGGTANKFRTFRTKVDEVAASAMVTALECGDYIVARILCERRPDALRKLMQRRQDVMQCIHAVARLVGRGESADADLLRVGRHIISTGIEYKEGSIASWLSEELVDSTGRSALHYASGASDPTFARTLLRNGANVNKEDGDGATPLCLAVESHASRASLETLLRAGAKVDAVDKRGRSALHRAAEARNGSAAATLLRWGARPMTSDAFGVAPAHIDNDLLHRASLFAHGDHEGTLPFDRMEQRMDVDGKLRYYTDSDHEEF